MIDIRGPDIKDLAEEDYMNGMKYKDIATKYNVSLNTIKSWKQRYKWNRKGMHTNKKVCTQNSCTEVSNTSKNKSSRLKKPSYPLQARPGNKNAVTTGEFETIFFDELEDEELSLVEKTPIKKIELLKQEIQLLTVRERRMLKRISNLKDKEITLVSSKSGIEKGFDTNIEEFEGTLGQIQRIEEALTRVQDKKQKAIDLLHKFEVDEQRLELTVMKLELDILKQGGQDEEVEDDGFMDAMKAEVGAVWDEY